MSFSISMIGAESMKRFLTDLPRDEQEIRQQILRQVAMSIVDEARSILQQRQNINTGELISDIGIKEEKINEILLGTTKLQGHIIEYGRGEVRPVNKKVLHFFTKNGDEVFTKYSKPVPPQPFLEPAGLKHRKDFPDLYFAKLENASRPKLTNDVKEY